MATKKVGKAAVPAPKKRRPRVGDVVWIEGKDIMGVFYCYDKKRRSLVLTWPAFDSILRPYVWPADREEFHPIDLDMVIVLTPSEILAKVDYFARVRDEQVQGRVIKFVEDNVQSMFMQDRHGAPPPAVP